MNVPQALTDRELYEAIYAEKFRALRAKETHGKYISRGSSNFGFPARPKPIGKHIVGLRKQCEIDKKRITDLLSVRPGMPRYAISHALDMSDKRTGNLLRELSRGGRARWEKGAAPKWFLIAEIPHQEG